MSAIAAVIILATTLVTSFISGIFGMAGGIILMAVLVALVSVAMGSFILLSSDVRIGTAGAFKIGANETQINMVLPIFASELVKARVNRAYLTRSMVFGELFDPETAVKVGYLDQVVDAAELMATAKAHAEALKPLSGPSLTGNKRLLRETTLATIGASLPD